jgi:2'-5' RNA ligase
MPRLFTALAVPDEIADRLVRPMAGLRGARWIDRGDLHLTLRFIGDVDGAMAEDAARALDDIRAAPFRVELTGLDAFGGDRPKSVHAAIRPDPALMALQQAQERRLQGAGLQPERRKFTPHITLGQLRRGDPVEVALWLAEAGPLAGVSFEAREFHLMSARNSTGGGPYVPVVTYPLDG